MSSLRSAPEPGIYSIPDHFHSQLAALFDLGVFETGGVIGNFTHTNKDSHTSEAKGLHERPIFSYVGDTSLASGLFGWKSLHVPEGKLGIYSMGGHLRRGRIWLSQISCPLVGLLRFIGDTRFWFFLCWQATNVDGSMHAVIAHNC